jgi:2-methylaconitate cis-trans-isomerase PrpF
MIRSTFETASGEAKVNDKTRIDGVSWLGTEVMLDFLRPSNSKTGSLLPTGKAAEPLLGFDVSCVDSANLYSFVWPILVQIRPFYQPR